MTDDTTTACEQNAKNCSIAWTDNWEDIGLGAYRYGECSTCGREFRMYFSYEHVETPDVTTPDGDPVIVQRR